MRNRIPGAGKAGRMLITPENGDASFYATVTMADDPAEEGTPLVKETLLTDATEVNLFGNVADRTVNEALNHIGTRLYQIAERIAAITVTVKDSGGHAIPNVLVSGVVDEAGNEMYTDATGTLRGFIAEGSQTISISKYADIEDCSATFNVLSGESYTKNLVVTTRNFIHLTASASYRFSGNVSTVDVSVGGGGGGGASGGANSGDYSGGGGGGGGGYCTVKTGIVPTPNAMYSAIVGAGGAGGDPSWYGGGAPTSGAGTSGGVSSFMGVSANGGSGGSGRSGGAGNGKGGNGGSNQASGGTYAASGTNGSSGSNRLYTSFTDSVVYGGGGGGGGEVSASGYASSIASGAGYGGNGGKASAASSSVGAENGTSVYGGGGGGGALYWPADAAYSGGDGGSGSVSFRMHLKSAA